MKGVVLVCGMSGCTGAGRVCAVFISGMSKKTLALGVLFVNLVAANIIFVVCALPIDTRYRWQYKSKETKRAVLHRRRHVFTSQNSISLALTRVGKWFFRADKAVLG